MGLDVGARLLASHGDMIVPLPRGHSTGSTEKLSSGQPSLPECHMETSQALGIQERNCLLMLNRPASGVLLQ